MLWCFQNTFCFYSTSKTHKVMRFWKKNTWNRPKMGKNGNKNTVLHHIGTHQLTTFDVWIKSLALLVAEIFLFEVLGGCSWVSCSSWCWSWWLESTPSYWDTPTDQFWCLNQVSSLLVAQILQFKVRCGWTDRQNDTHTDMPI